MRALARENSDIVDGPYAGRFTAYGLLTYALKIKRHDRCGLISNMTNTVDFFFSGIVWETNFHGFGG